MSAIDELKNGGALVIDTLSGEDGTDNDTISESGVMIDATEPDATNVVDLSGLANKKHGNHTMVLPKDKSSDNSQKRQQRTPVARTTIDISTLDNEVEEDETEEIHESLQKDILNLDDPNSIFSQYIAKETAEATEWIAEKEEEKALLEAEEADEKALDEFESDIDEEEYDTDEEGIDYVEDTNTEYVSSNMNITEVEMEDISSFLEKDEEEEIMSNTDDVILTQTEDPEAAIPVENEEEEVVEEFDMIEDESVEELESDEIIKPETEAPEYKEPEHYDAPDGIDAEVENSDENFATEITEEDEAANAAANADNDEVLKQLQKLATEKLKPVSKSLDISSFTIVKKPITNVAPVLESQKAKVAKWVLPGQDSIVLMKEFSGSELEKLREYSENNRSVESLRRRFNIIYDHIASPKPSTFDQWVKTTPYEDVDNYFFAIYIASFKGANYLPADCPNTECGETYLSDDIKIMDMVKFETKEAQNKFAELYQSEATPAGKGIYCTEVVPLSNKIAISFREPSINSVFEIAGLDDKTRTTYSDIIDYIPYIDTIYVIDQANKTLTPITYKMYPDNPLRTTRSKIQKFSNVFNTLSADEFGPIKAYVRAIAEKKQDMYYVYPSINCPKCGHPTEETRTTAEELVFTRYQLGSLVTTSLS